MSESELNNLCVAVKSSALVTESRSCKTIIRLLAGALLNRNMYRNNEVSYDLFNPSIADFVIAHYLDDFGYIDDLLMCLRTPHSISNLNSLMSSGSVKPQFYYHLLESQLLSLSRERNCNDIDGYKLRILSHMQSYYMNPSDDVIDYMKHLSKEALRNPPKSYGIDYFKFISWSLSLKIINKEDTIFMENLKRWVLVYHKEEEDFILISKMVAVVEEIPLDLTENLKEQYVQYLSEQITYLVMDEEILDEVYDRDSYSPRKVETCVEKKFSALAIDFDDSDVDSVVDCCDIDHIIEENIYAAKSLRNRQPNRPDDNQKNDERSSTDIINDLFDRS